MWKWMLNEETPPRKISQQTNFKLVLLAGYDVLCKELPEKGDLAYREAVYKAHTIGMSQEEAEAAAALYFTFNYERSPLERDLENGREFVPLEPLFDELYGWIRDHQDIDATEAVRKYAEKFIGIDEATPRETVAITQLVPTDKVIFPISKAFQHQPDIAAFGNIGAEISVDNKGTFIEATITGQGGQKIDITPEQQQIQAVIGQMITENGAPITVTPAQIYRAFSGMPNDGKVNPEQEEFIVTNLDRLMKTDARIDFTRQIQAHKGIKKDPAFDYRKTTFSGALVIGMKIEDGRAAYNGARRDVAYIVYETPMYYAYSKAVNQIAQADRTMLAGGAAAQKLPDGHPDKKPLQRRPMTVVLRRYLMQQIVRMEGAKKKQEAASIKQRKKPAATHDENLTIETIAKSCGIGLTDKLRRNLIANTTTILQDFKAGGHIKDFEDYKQGRAVKGFTIKV